MTKAKSWKQVESDAMQGMRERAAATVVLERKRTARFIKDYCEHVGIDPDLESVKSLMSRLNKSTRDAVLKERGND